MDVAEIVATLRAAADGRDEYADADSTSPDDAGLLRHEASAFRAAAQMIETGDRSGFLADQCPSWRWAALGVDISTRAAKS